MEKQSQEKVWDGIAASWHSFRQRPLKIAEANAIKWKPGRILDIGCGNCRNLLPFAKHGFECYGYDFSREMLKHARQYLKKHDFKVQIKKSAAEKNPFNKKFDYILALRILPMIESKEKRNAVVKEIKESLKPKGRVLVSIWNSAYSKYWKHLFKKHAYVPWNSKGRTFMRHYYMYSPFGIRKILRQHGFRILKKSKFFAEDYWLEVEKV